MYQFLETIKIKQGRLQNISIHNERFNRCRKEIFGRKDALLLENEIHLSKKTENGIYKCRILYKETISKIEMNAYEIPNIKSLKIVHDNYIQYPYKSENRDEINSLYLLKGECDDILIIRNEFIMDTSYCNIVFSDGNSLITPSTPLLKGCKRELLLREGKIHEKDIKLKDLHLFKKAYLINSMIDLEDNVEIIMNKII
ncbi:MAG: aminotransferase class IV [Bacteroidota bacterium]